MALRVMVLAMASLLAAGCTSVRVTSPARSTQELLLISTAADRAAEALAAQVPANITAYVDPSGFSVQDGPYGLAAIEDALLRRGVRLVIDRNKADAVILPRAGTLSTFEQQSLFGVPSMPVPMAPGVIVPPLSLYQESITVGTAKFAASVYDPRTGQMIVSTNPAYGFSRDDEGVILFFIAWHRNDVGVDFNTYPPKQ